MSINNVSYSGLKMSNRELGNNQSAILSKIQKYIHKAMQFVKYGNAAYELVTVTTQLLKVINAKVTTKKQILQKNREQNEKQEGSEQQKIIEQVKKDQTLSNTQTKPIKVEQPMMVFPEQKINEHHGARKHKNQPNACKQQMIELLTILEIKQSVDQLILLSIN